jgi:hypothetical protein
VTDLNITVLGDEGDSNDWTKQRSPRKRKPTPSRKSEAIPDEQGLTREPTTAGRIKKRTTRSAPPVEIRQDTDAEDDVGIDTAANNDSPELRSIDLNRVAVRPRSMSTKHHPPIPTSKDISINEDHADQGENVFEADPKNVSIISANYPTPDPSVQDDQEVDEPAFAVSVDHVGFDTLLESEGFTMIDLDSIPSVRQFLSSPLDAAVQLEPPETTANLQSKDGLPSPTLHKEQTTPSALQPTKLAPRAIPSYLTMPEGESDISSNVPSSPPVMSQPHRRMPLSARVSPQASTPRIYSSPKLPSPPKVSHPRGNNNGAQPRKSTPPTLAKVVKAGIALQGVLSPKSTNSKQRTLGGTPEERLDNLFQGFDSGTRRELRAGLRLGEELAKRQRSSPDVEKPCKSPDLRSNNIDQAARNKVSAGTCVPVTQVWRGQTVLQNTPLQSSKDGRNANIPIATIASHKDDKPVPARRKSSLCNELSFTSSTPPTKAPDNKTQVLSESQKRRELEWQREREAVSKEIESASSSQVVVIDSDDEGQITKGSSSVPESGIDHGEQSELDIWCEEAASCDQRSSKGATRPIRASQAEVTPEPEQILQQAQVADGKKKSRRSLIPSPWRRGDNIAGETSGLTNGDMTGLFYHEPKTKIKFGAAEIERQKRQFSSGSFDIDRMAGTSDKTRAVDSQTSAGETDSLQTVESDAQQLQAELGMNQSQIDTTDLDREGSEEASMQSYLDEEADVEHVGIVSEYTEEDSYSLPPQPVKIPVNFNDSTISHTAPCLKRSSPSTAPDSSRPSTPRSALKGARQSLGFEDVNSLTVRKVIFSTHETRVDLNGQEEQLSMQSASSSPEAVSDGEDEQKEEEEEPQPWISRAKQDSPKQTTGLLGWLWNSGSKSKSTVSPPIDGANDQASKRPTTKTTTATNPPKPTRTAARIPSYLLPPSYPSDPTRDIKTAMSTSGDFTNTHFRTLHIIYAKSLRPRFHAPKAHDVRPSLRALLGTAFEADESQSGLGVFDWHVDEMALRVVERFMREVEWGYPAGGKVRWGWSEKEICQRLFRVVVGEEVRREEKAALEKGRD